MKIGINRWTMPPGWTLERCFQAAKQAGFDGIEINVEAEGELTTSTDETAVRRFHELALEIGIELTSLSTGLGWKFPLTSNDREIPDRGKDIIRNCIHIARWLGVNTVLCVPGVVDAETSYDAAYDHAQSALRDLSLDAAANEVHIGVENVWNRFLLSPLEMARFVDEIGSKWVGVYFDVGNVLQFGFPQQWIRILGPRIVRIHVKDFKQSIGNGRAFANPLQGDVPWKEVRIALDEIGYEGYVTAEVEGYKQYPELGLKHIAESLREVFA
jgi:L-ribulose-5-phosphate 3-epimerase